MMWCKRMNSHRQLLLLFLLDIPESAPMGESRKSCLVLGRSRSCLVMLATYSIVCSRNPVVKFDGVNSILLLIVLLDVSSIILFQHLLHEMFINWNGFPFAFSASFNMSNLCQRKTQNWLCFVVVEKLLLVNINRWTGLMDGNIHNWMLCTFGEFVQIHVLNETYHSICRAINLRYAKIYIFLFAILLMLNCTGRSICLFWNRTFKK